MRLLRTPDERFARLPGFELEPHYLEVASGDGPDPIRVAFLDEGPATAADTIVLLHGEPSWSFLYRKMVGPLVAEGFRVIAPDLVGFGRSDKPAERGDYTYARHVEWMRAALFGELALSDVTLVGQDWGGLIGLRLVAAHPERFRRVVAANTGLPTGDGKVSDALLAWQRFSQEAPDLPVGKIVRGGCTSPIADDVVAAYDAPFPDPSFKEGARQFPVLIPIRPDDPGAEDNRRGLGRARAVRQAVPVRLQRPRSDHPGGRPAVPRAGPGGPGPGPSHHLRRRPLPAGGPGRGAGRNRRRLRPKHPLLTSETGTPWAARSSS